MVRDTIAAITLIDHHLHRTIRASHHAALAANTARLEHLHAAILVIDGLVRAGVQARGILTLAAQHRYADAKGFHHP
ncbi:hypothetical protein D3C81_1957910 [compost metagenome]